MYVRVMWMKVEKVRVRNFRSYRDSGELILDGKITTMIGKNESGKTNFLKSLESLNADYEYSSDDLCYYSEEGRKPDESIEMVTVWFATDAEDRKKLRVIWGSLARAKKIRMTKYFDDHYKFQVEDPNIALPEPVVKMREDLKERIEGQIEDLSDKIEKHGIRYAVSADNEPKFKEIVQSFLSTDFSDPVAISKELNAFIVSLENLPNQDTPILEDIEVSIEKIREIVTESTETLKFGEKILEIIPNFVYFDAIDLLENSVNTTDFLKSRKKFKTFRRLAELANLNVEKLVSGKVFDRRFATEEASTTITGMVNKSWTQEKVEVKIGIDAKDLYVYVLDESGGHDPPSKRSDGFQWFLSFYINFMSGSKGEFKNTVLLLDNPGVYLHPSGQKDLLQTLEEIAETNQIVFTTHSPFLIDRKRLGRVRIVLKGGLREGTIIKEKFHPSNFDALEPIRASIGMTLGDALFGTKKNLVVEGYSDNLILEAISAFCKRIGKSHLGSKIAIVAVGSADRIPYYALLLSKENLPHVIVLDNDTKGRRVRKLLLKDYGIEEEVIVTLDDVDPERLKGIDLEIEDLVDPAFYNRAVNESYEEILQGKSEEPIATEELDASLTKQTKKYERLFRDRKLGGFDKVLVAKQMYNIISDKKCTPGSVGKETLENFGKLFEIVNEKLK